jgi:hypothetical protein
VRRIKGFGAFAEAAAEIDDAPDLAAGFGQGSGSEAVVQVAMLVQQWCGGTCATLVHHARQRIAIDATWMLMDVGGGVVGRQRHARVQGKGGAVDFKRGRQRVALCCIVVRKTVAAGILHALEMALEPAEIAHRRVVAHEGFDIGRRFRRHTPWTAGFR